MADESEELSQKIAQFEKSPASEKLMALLTQQFITGDRLRRLTIVTEKMEQEVQDMRQRLDLYQLKSESNEIFVRRDEFSVVRNIVYGMVALIIVAVFITVLNSIGLKTK